MEKRRQKLHALTILQLGDLQKGSGGQGQQKEWFGGFGCEMIAYQQRRGVEYCWVAPVGSGKAATEGCGRGKRKGGGKQHAVEVSLENSRAIMRKAACRLRHQRGHTQRLRHQTTIANPKTLRLLSSRSKRSRSGATPPSPARAARAAPETHARIAPSSPDHETPAATAPHTPARCRCSIDCTSHIRIRREQSRDHLPEPVAHTCPRTRASESHRFEQWNGFIMAHINACKHLPTACTSPANSCPGVCGKVLISGSCPCQPCQSLRHNPAAKTLITQSWSPGCGTSRETTLMLPRNSEYCRASMVGISGNCTHAQRGQCRPGDGQLNRVAASTLV